MTDEAEKLAVGSTAPDFLLPAANGSQIKLSEFRGKGNLVLYFMRAFT